MCLIRVRQEEEEEVIPTRVAKTTVITPIPPAPPPPPAVSYTNNLVPTTAIYDTDNNYENYTSNNYEANNYESNNYESNYASSAYNESNNNYRHHSNNNEQYAVSVIDGPPTTIIKHGASVAGSRHSVGADKRRRHRHRRRSGSREREVTTYEFNGSGSDNEYDAKSMRSGVSRSRSIDHRRSSGYYGGEQDARSSYRYIDPRGSSQRVVSGGTATVKTTKISRSEVRSEIDSSDGRGRDRDREREMYSYGNSYGGRRSGSISHVNPRMSTASYKSYGGGGGGGGRRSRERVIVVDDENGRVRYY